MREILFRGKRTDNGEWIEGDLLQYLASGKMHIVRRCLGAGGVEIIPETVGQYTGLTVNGTELFEGDVIRRKGNFMASNYVVKYIDKYAAFIGMARGNNEIYLHRCDENFVVIGNIHDNPELSKEYKK